MASTVYQSTNFLRPLFIPQGPDGCESGSLVCSSQKYTTLYSTYIYAGSTSLHKLSSGGEGLPGSGNLVSNKRRHCLWASMSNIWSLG